MLYSMEWEPHKECLYFALNATLRTEDRLKLKSWFSYLKLVLTALEKLPSTRCNVYRGVNLDLTKQYTEGKTFIWWGFSSCTTSIKVLENEQFLDKTGERTLFTIECDSGKDISRHSYFQSEKEVLLLAARQFIVIACLQPAPGLHMIQLKETKPSITLLQSATNPSVQIKPTPHPSQSNDLIIKNPITTLYKKLTKVQSQLKQKEIQTKKNKYRPFATTVAGGNGRGQELNQLSRPYGIFIDNDKSIYIADCENQRIVRWNLNSNKGEITAGGNESGNESNQLNVPTDIIFDKENNSFIIADNGNKRVIRYFDQNQEYRLIIISNIHCYGLTIVKNGFIYVSDIANHEVRRWKQGDKKGKLIDGGNGCLHPALGLHMIQLKETKPPITLLQPATNQSVQIKPTSDSYQSKHSTASTATILKNPVTPNEISTQSQTKQSMFH
ncbi:unnamed protein product [Adineta steineri]|uniref:NAD(P)(+)--arginine ADP-ribosyltransferase n=2 Tax=Adineta steineri TaxID=433720 RepID=A0A813NR54_9BILA|nr:unnamed protein product [Adineta steineri]